MCLSEDPAGSNKPINSKHFSKSQQYSEVNWSHHHSACRHALIKTLLHTSHCALNYRSGGRDLETEPLQSPGSEALEQDSYEVCSGWGTHVNPWLIHVNVWQKPLQYYKVISLQLIKINGKKKNCINLLMFACLFVFLLLWLLGTTEPNLHTPHPTHTPLVQMKIIPPLNF